MRLLLLAIMGAVLASSVGPARAQPVTGDELISLPPKVLARRLLGPTGDLMVGIEGRRTGWGDVTFFTEPRVHGVLCAATFVTVRVDSGDHRNFRPALVWSGERYLYPADFDVKPLDQDAIDRHCKTLDPLSFYSASGNEVLWAQDSGRYFAQAVREARNDGPLSFELECQRASTHCEEPRAHLAALSIDRFRGHEVISCPQRWDDHRRVICYRVYTAPADTRPGLRQTLEIGVADNWSDRRLLFVSVFRTVPPPPVY